MPWERGNRFYRHGRSARGFPRQMYSRHLQSVHSKMQGETDGSLEPQSIRPFSVNKERDEE